MISIVCSGRGHQFVHANALKKGFDLLGINSLIAASSYNIKTKYIACWGWRVGKSFRNAGYEVLVMERGYIGDRFKYTSLGWNGLNGHADFPAYPSDDGERFKLHGGKIKPWKKHGEYILILGQVKGDASLKGNDITEWYYNTARQIKEKYGLPVYFRPHPESERRGGYKGVDGVQNIGGTLDEALSKALFTVAYNSNSCLDSILAGIPCYAGDRGTMAWNLCMENIDEIITPIREPIVYDIAWKQWEISEIENGKALRKIAEHIK